MSSSHPQQPLMATPVDDLQAVVRGYDIENRELQQELDDYHLKLKELQQELDDCHQKLKELSSRPVVHAEFEPEHEPEHEPEVSSIREAILELMKTQDIDGLGVKKLVALIKARFPELVGVTKVNTKSIRDALFIIRTQPEPLSEPEPEPGPGSEELKTKGWAIITQAKFGECPEKDRKIKGYGSVLEWNKERERKDIVEDMGWFGFTESNATSFGQKSGWWWPSDQAVDVDDILNNLEHDLLKDTYIRPGASMKLLKKKEKEGFKIFIQGDPGSETEIETIKRHIIIMSKEPSFETLNLKIIRERLEELIGKSMDPYKKYIKAIVIEIIGEQGGKASKKPKKKPTKKKPKKPKKKPKKTKKPKKKNK